MKITHWRLWMVLMVVGFLALVACGDDEKPAPTEAPTIQPTEIVQQMTETPTPGGPTRTASPTFLPTATVAPATATMPLAPTQIPTGTPGPYEHVIQEGQTCGELAFFYDSSVQAIEQANLGLDCQVLSVGQTVFVPRPTSTPTPMGFAETATAIYEALPPGLQDVTPFAIYTYCPGEDDTLTSISLQHDTTNQRICELNAGPDELDCRGCDFSESAVGFCPNPPIISTSKCYNVPGPTYTVTFTPTFTGEETATSTPTHAPPRLVFPQNGATISDNTVRLTWLLPGGRLAEGEWYAVTVVDELTGELLVSSQTRNTDLTLASEWRPPVGQTRQVQWTVEVIVMNEAGVLVPVSGRSLSQRFAWRGP